MIRLKNRAFKGFATKSCPLDFDNFLTLCVVCYLPIGRQLQFVEFTIVGDETFFSTRIKCFNATFDDFVCFFQ